MSGSKDAYILNLDTGGRSMVRFLLRTLYFQGRSIQYPLSGSLVDLRTGLDQVLNREIPAPASVAA
jgi:hypothetical protein